MYWVHLYSEKIVSKCPKVDHLHVNVLAVSATLADWPQRRPDIHRNSVSDIYMSLVDDFQQNIPNMRYPVAFPETGKQCATKY